MCMQLKRVYDKKCSLNPRLVLPFLTGFVNKNACIQFHHVQHSYTSLTLPRAYLITTLTLINITNAPYELRICFFMTKKCIHDFRLHQIWYLVSYNMITFWMSLMNKWTNIIMDDEWIHPSAKSLPLSCQQLFSWFHLHPPRCTNGEAMASMFEWRSHSSPCPGVSFAVLRNLSMQLLCVLTALCWYGVAMSWVFSRSFWVFVV